MESTKQIRSIRPIRGQKKQSLPPSLQGGAGGRLSPNQARSAANPKKRCSKCFKCFRCFISLLDQKRAFFLVQIGTKQVFQVFQLFQVFQVFRIHPSLQGGAGG